MELRKYLDGDAYHMVHLDNLYHIFQYGALLSKERVLYEKISYRSIAHDQVQNRRDRISVWDNLERRFRPLHSYVPFYFAMLTPMLYVQLKQEIQDKIVIFEVRRSILNERGVIFTDGNATNQQLSNDALEEVDIIPSHRPQENCRRRYRPLNGPFGTNPHRSNFYNHISCLQCLNWDIINDRWFNDKEKGRIKHAEVLVPDFLMLEKLAGIAVSNKDTLQRVNELIKQSKFRDRIPLAKLKQSLFFQTK